MIGQRVIIIVLAGLIPLWGWGMYSQFSTDEVEPPAKTGQQKTTPAKKSEQPSLNPKMARTLPNLNQGYLFNSERFLKSSGMSTTTNTVNSQNINMDTLQYDGSLIVGETRKAIISFVTGATAKPQRVTQKAPGSRRPATQVNRSSKIIALGDTVAGYTVSQIEPEKITFNQGSNEITKELFSTEKKRQAAPITKQKKPAPARVTKPVKKATPQPQPPQRH